MKEKRMHRVHRRQVSSIPPTPTGSGFTSAVTVTDNDVNTASLLLDETATGKTGGVPTTLVIPPTLSSSSAASATASDSSASKSDSISIGAVVGICFGVAAGLAALLGLVYIYILKNRPSKTRGTGKEAERRRSGRELWVKMEDKDGDGNYEKYSIKRATMTSASPSDGTAVGRSITVKSAKSTKTFKSLGYGTNLGLAETFKTPDLPPHLEFTDANIGSGRSFVGHDGPSGPSAPFTREEHPPISWDGETVRDGESYLSLKRGNNSVQIAKQPVSSAMVVSYPTPPAVETTLPQWERAEIVSPEGAEDAYAAMDEPRHPYAAARSSEETIRRPPPAVHPQSQSSRQAQPETANPFGDQNPFEDVASASAPRAAALTPNTGTGTTSDSDSFFTTRSNLTVRTGAFAAPATVAAAAAAAHHERMDSNERAMASLIAALNISQEEARERLSAAIAPSTRESSGSGYSLGVTSLESKDSEALDENSFKQFPLPPTGVQRRNLAP